jgi:hypothetical protein
VTGVLIGGAIMHVLLNAINLFVLWPNSPRQFKLGENSERFIVGAVVLIAVLIDYLFRSGQRVRFLGQCEPRGSPSALESVHGTAAERRREGAHPVVQWL